MLFNSIDFIFFFILVTFLYYILPYRYRWLQLLLFSCFFYMYFIPQYIFILLGIILIDYFAAIKIEEASRENKKKYLIISIIITCLVLIIFKYLNFFNQNIIQLSQVFGFKYSEKEVGFILPIGLSFHTFQSLSYVIEVYRGNVKAERHFGIYSLYVMFYPQLVTGPIERPQQLLVQLRKENKMELSNIINGLRLILFGLFVKMVVADNLSVYVDELYKNLADYNSLSILIGLFFYSFQIYGDFLGYSTIAVGSARVLGYNLMDNFKTPYLATNIISFWQRWHISLSSWFRDYIYISLGGNKVKLSSWVFIILLVFLLSGFWHGANWTFVVWGLLHGVFYIIEKISSKYFSVDSIQNIFIRNSLIVLSSLKTFLLVTILWVFFRATDLKTVNLLFASIFNNTHVQHYLTIDASSWLFLFLFILMDFVLYKTRFDIFTSKQPIAIRWSVYSILIFLVIVFSSVHNTPFIYFQF